MRISRISVAGFRGIRDHLDLSVDDGFMVMTGRNGSGKSTICDAVEYALTGTLSRFAGSTENQESIDDYVWWRDTSRPPDRFVEVTFKKEDGELLTVMRRPETTQANFDSLYAEEFCRPGTSRAGWSSELVRTAFIRSETVAQLSVDLPEVDRFTVVERALGVPAATRYEKLISEALTELNNQKEAAEGDYEKLQNRVVTMTAEVARRREEFVSAEDTAAAEEVLRTMLNWQGSEKEDFDTLRSRLKSIRVAAGRIESRYHEYLDVKQRIAEADQQQSDTKTKTIRSESDQLAAEAVESEERLALLTAELEVLEGQVAGRRDLAQLAAAGEKVGLRNGKCPLCRSKLSDETFAEALDRLRKQLDDADVRYNHVVSERQREAEKLAILKARQTQLQDMLRKIDGTVERLSAEERAIAEDLAVETKLKEVSSEDLSTWITDQSSIIRKSEDAIVELVTARLLETADEMESELESVRKEADEAAARAAAVRGKIDELKELRTSLKQAAKNIVDERFAAVSPLLTELYRRLRPHTRWREVDYNIRGDVRKFLSLRVGDGINPRFVFSSGQRRAAGIAFLLAVHLAQSWCSLDTLVLDDPIQHIDDFRALHLVEVLAAIRKTGRQIICSVEDPALADLLVRRLQVEPLLGGSRVELRHDASDGVVVNSHRRNIFALPSNVLRTA